MSPWGTAGERRRVVLRCVAALVVGVALLAACSSSTSGGSSAATTTTAASTAVTATTVDAHTPSTRAVGGVPDLTGSPVPAAVSALHKAGFGSVVAVDASGRNRTVGLGNGWTVVDQSVPAHASINPATTVTVFATRQGGKVKNPLALGYVSMPDLLYTPVGSGLDQLVALRLIKVTITDFSGQNRPVPPDTTWTITSQDPIGGSWVKVGTPVNLSALPAREATPSHTP